MGVALHITSKESLSKNTLRRYERKVQPGETSFSPSYTNNQIFSVEEGEKLGKYVDLTVRMNQALT